jgi:hypothetical protein
MVIDNSTIIAGRGTHILKFLLNTPTLATSDIAKNHINLSLENPVNQNLVYQSKEKVNKIEIYSLTGKR